MSPTPDPEPSTEMASASHWPQMTGQAISDYLGFSAPWLRKLELGGFVDRQANGLFDAGDVCRGYIRFLKNEDRRSSKTEQAKQKEAEQVEKLRIENAKARNELVDIETIEAFFAELFTTLRQEIDSVPAGATRDLNLRADIESRLNGAFDRCRSRFEANQEALRSGRLVLDAEEEGTP